MESATSTNQTVSPIAVPDLIEADAEKATYTTADTTEETNNVVHDKCGKVTALPPAIARAHHKDPKQFMNLPCHHCQGQHPASQFQWATEAQSAAG